MQAICDFFNKGYKNIKLLKFVVYRLNTLLFK